MNTYTLTHSQPPTRGQIKPFVGKQSVPQIWERGRVEPERSNGIEKQAHTQSVKLSGHPARVEIKTTDYKYVYHLISMSYFMKYTVILGLEGYCS